MLLTERGIHQSSIFNSICINETTNRKGYTPVGM